MFLRRCANRGHHCYSADSAIELQELSGKTRLASGPVLNSATQAESSWTAMHALLLMLSPSAVPSFQMLKERAMAQLANTIQVCILGDCRDR